MGGASKQRTGGDGGYWSGYIFSPIQRQDAVFLFHKSHELFGPFIEGHIFEIPLAGFFQDLPDNFIYEGYLVLNVSTIVF
ncbi:hypothetical protein MASR2M79_07860 [Aminivibrio sp.]